LSNLGNTVSAAGTAVAAAGNTIVSSLPLPSPQIKSGLSGVVDNASGIVNGLGATVTNGLGQIGSNPNAVSSSVAGVGGVVTQAINTATSIGQVVGAVGSGPLAPLAPVTVPVGGLVTQVSATASTLAAPVNSVLSSGPVQQITQTVGQAIVPLISTVNTLTQTVGNTTGLNQPVNSLLTAAGAGINTLGNASTGANVPVVGSLGSVASAVGASVAGLGTNPVVGTGQPLLGSDGGSVAGRSARCSVQWCDWCARWQRRFRR
jgi:hypothetical protein